MSNSTSNSTSNSISNSTKHEHKEPLLIILSRSSFLDIGHLRREIDGIDTTYDIQQLEKGVTPEINLGTNIFGCYDDLMDAAMASLMSNTSTIPEENLLTIDRKPLKPKVRRLSANNRKKAAKQETEAILAEEHQFDNYFNPDSHTAQLLFRHQQDKKTIKPKTGVKEITNLPVELEKSSTTKDSTTSIIKPPKHNPQSLTPVLDETGLRELNARLEARGKINNYFEYDITYVEVATEFGKQLFSDYDIKIKTLSAVSAVPADTNDDNDELCIIYLPVDYAAWDYRLKECIDTLLISLHRKAEFDRNPDSYILHLQNLAEEQFEELNKED